MRIFLSAQFKKSFRKLKKKNPKIITTIKEKIVFFQENPHHPSLRLHKLHGKKIILWSFWIKSDLRITYTYVSRGVLFVNIGSHKEVY